MIKIGRHERAINLFYSDSFLDQLQWVLFYRKEFREVSSRALADAIDTAPSNRAAVGTILEILAKSASLDANSRTAMKNLHTRSARSLDAQPKLPNI